MSTDLVLNCATRLAAAALLALAVTGCNESARPDNAAAEVAWARAALARNPALEIVDVDEKAKLFTVRERAGGALHTLRLDEIAAAPVAMLRAAPAGALPAGAAAPTATATAAATAAADAAAAQPESAVVASTPPAAPGGTGPGAQASAAPGYAVERSPGGVTITGPGVSITSVGAPNGAAARGAAAAASAARAEVAPAGSIERRSEPLHCQGERSLHIDNQRLAFAGDGVVAERGCEVYLTNSRVEALGTAVIADASRVHVSNSTIIGGTGSLQLQNGGEAYVGDSTVTGMSRRFDSSALHDLGGNQWK